MFQSINNQAWHDISRSLANIHSS